MLSLESNKLFTVQTYIILTFDCYSAFRSPFLTHLPETHLKRDRTRKKNENLPSDTRPSCICKVFSRSLKVESNNHNTHRNCLAKKSSPLICVSLAQPPLLIVWTLRSPTYYLFPTTTTPTRKVSFLAATRERLAATESR